MKPLYSQINLKVVNNTALPQPVSILGIVPNQNSANNSNILYEFNLTGQSFVTTASVNINISNTSNPTIVVYNAPVTTQSIQGVVDALNTLNQGIFSYSGSTIYVSSSYYIYSNISIAGTSILGTTGLNPIGITIDSAGNIFTSNNSTSDVSKITPSGVSTILASTGNPPVAITIDSIGNLYLPIPSFSSVAKITPSGVGSSFGFTGGFPTCITIDSGGFIYTANSVGNNITKISPLGVGTNYGNLNGENPVGIVVDSVGNVFAVCSANVVRKVTPAGVSSNFGVFSLGNTLTSIAIDSSDNIYVSDNSNQIIYKLTPSAVQTTYGTSTNNPQQIAIDSLDNIYCVNQNGTVDKILTTGGTITLTDLSVYLGSPYAIIVDSFFNVYVTDANNNVVYLIVQ
jgi:hypothetical protein